MAKKSAKKRARLSPLENAVMEVLWSQSDRTAEEIRLELAIQHDLKGSTVRTILRRLEDKGYVAHDLDGRTFVYRARVAQQNVATSAVKGIIDRFCSGSIENLLVGLVDDEVITPAKLQKLAEQIARSKQASNKQTGEKRRKK